MVVRQHLKILAKHDGGIVGIAREARDRHGLGAAGELPKDLIAPAHLISRTGSLCRRDRIRELDAVDHFVREARANGNVELVAVAVASTQALVALTRLVKRVV